MKLALLFLSAVLAVACVSDPSEKLGVRPSGPGQTVKASSQSVAIASDQLDKGFIATVPNVVTAVTKSDSTDTSTYCNRGVYISNDAGLSTNLSVVASSVTYTDAAQAVTFQVNSNAFIPGSFQRIMSTGTTAQGIVCLGAQ